MPLGGGYKRRRTLREPTLSARDFSRRQAPHPGLYNLPLQKIMAPPNVPDTYTPHFREAADRQEVRFRTRDELGGASGMAQLGPEAEDVIYLSEPSSSIFTHEVGHRVDETSMTPEFQDALYESLQQEGPFGVEDPSLYQGSQGWMREFPGVHGNPKGGWGGPVELYAELMARSGGDITRVPPPLRQHYAPFLGEPLSRGQQAWASRYRGQAGADTIGPRELLEMSGRDDFIAKLRRLANERYHPADRSIVRR